MEYLDMIILLVSCIFEVYIYYDFFDSYLEIRSEKQTLEKRIVWDLFVTISLFIMDIFGNIYINIVGFILLIWIYSIVIFQANMGSRILYFLIILLISFGCEILFGILSKIPIIYINRRDSFVSLADIPWYVFTIKLLMYVLFNIIKQFFKFSKKKMDNKVFISYACIPILSIAIMTLTCYSGSYALTEWAIKLLFSINFAILLFVNILDFNAFYCYSEKIYVKVEREPISFKQTVEFEELQKINSQHLQFSHDIIHCLKAIGELAKNNETSNIISIIQDLNIELENNILTLYCSNSVVNTILSEKRSIAEKSNISLDIYIEPSVTFIEISDADIIIMLGNLLDNALRAAKDAEDKSIVIRMYSENEGHFYIIKIQNHFIKSIFSTDIGFISTKKEKGVHGIGIKSVKNIAQKYNGYLECFVEDDLFTVLLVLSTL